MQPTSNLTSVSWKVLNNNNNPIDIALAAEALKDIISSDNRREVTPELILDIVADHFGITVADLKSKKRDSEIAVPRQICMYLMRTMTDTALKGIGAVLGGKDQYNKEENQPGLGFSI